MMAKRFSKKIMEYPVTFLVSQGMNRVLEERKKKTGESHSDYLRGLVKKDLQIDDYGEKINTR